ncbi:polysaccharide biosynthesis tyrosine autokinase [Orrella marina]|uniref:Lipopolysaccharide biosynthesis protein n=1 Tax=Orrella marina TaxID=2163011 RepID=A0A2R4XGI1_9BURK|nr:polysaccharide biosynthesis tyrosine autokinase [Orrella marina]AWB32905.1 lipopolysaccharide biosynthesis protein [Orrella marina]
MSASNTSSSSGSSNAPVSYPQGHPNGGAVIQDDDTISLVDLLDNFLYYKWYFIIVTLIAGALSLGYAIIATPIYTADALIQIEEKKGSSLFSGLGDGATSLFAPTSPIVGEIEIIRSRSVIGQAVESLNANVDVSVQNRIPVIGEWLSRVLDKDENGLVIPMTDALQFAWGGEKLQVNNIRVPDHLYGKALLLEIGEGRSWALSVEETGELLLKGQGSGQQLSALNGQFQIELGPFQARPGTVFRVVVLSLQNEIRRATGGLSVAESGRQSSLIRMTYESPDPQYAALMLNTIADAYLRQNLERRSAEAEKTLQFLKGELPRLREQLDLSEQALNEFRTRTRTVDMTFELQELLTRSADIETQQMQADLKRRELAIRYDPSHPVMRALDSQITGLNSDAEEISSRISKLPAVQQDYIRLARNVEVSNELYLGLLNTTQQFEIARAGTVGNVAIIDRAVVPQSPTKPSKSMIVAVGTMAGMFLGFLLTQVVAFMTKVVRDPKKLELETGISTLSIMPLDGEQMKQVLENDNRPFMLAHEQPDGAGAEALRSLRTALIFALSEKPRSKVVLITSAVPSQGKSFISANLAYLLCATGKKVLLIDADIRKSSMRRYLNFDPKAPGLTDLLKSSRAGEPASVDDVVMPDLLESLDFLPTGSRVRNPGDLLAGEPILELINRMAERYDYVLIDSPPLLPVHDARSLGKVADISLFVARQDAVSLSEVQDAIDVFSKVGNRFDGLVFNGFVPSRIRYGYGYGYGYRKYAGRYGKYATYGRYGRYYDSADDSKDGR